MIDSWLVASILLFVLALCAAVRILPGPTRLDRLVAVNVTVTIACTGLFLFAISLGNLLMLDFAILLAVIFFFGTIWSAGKTPEDPA